MNHSLNSRIESDILVVDDHPDNLRLLLNIFSENGYSTRLASSGELALNSIRTRIPDLILLDIQMPKMNGFELCRKLKSDPHTKLIPIIFISALNDIENKVSGYQAGGVDYISKPFFPEEVLVRVKTQLHSGYLQKKLELEVEKRKRVEVDLRNLNQELQESNKRLETAKSELEDAKIIQRKFNSIIGHDVRGAFSGLFGMTQLLQENLLKYDKSKIECTVGKIRTGTERLYNLLDNLLVWSRHKSNLIEYEPRAFPLSTLTDQNLSIFKRQTEQKNIFIQNDIDLALNTVFADPNVVSILIQNLLSNAIKFTERGGKITISNTRKDEQWQTVSIADNGVGMSQTELDILFNLDRRRTKIGTAGEQGNGIGLPLCEELISKCQGSIEVESQVGKGTIFSITLPLSEELSSQPADSFFFKTEQRDESIQGFKEP